MIAVGDDPPHPLWHPPPPHNMRFLGGEAAVS
jgi:hypothetical protein